MLLYRRRVYLDNNATTPVAPEARRAICRVLRDCHGNPSSSYRVARRAALVLEDARDTLARTINAAPGEITFTGSASEANNQVIQSLAAHFPPDKRKIVSSPVEHASIMETLAYVATRGIEVVYCPVDRFGRMRLDRLAELVDDGTFLVCAMRANNETGTLQDITAIAAIAHAHGALLLADCVQALGKVPVDVRSLGADYATFSAHKIHGPKGVGALWTREGAPLFALIHGGHQERGLRAGTEGVHNLAGFAAALRNLPRLLAGADILRARRDAFVAALRVMRPDLELHTPEADSLPNTASVTFPGTSNAVLLSVLDFHGIAVSAGSACNTQLNTPSHVLSALGLPEEMARATLRFSLSESTRPAGLRYTERVLRRYFEGRLPQVAMVSPAQLDEDVLFSEKTFILDIRFGYERRMLKSLPGAHEAAFFGFRHYLHAVPRDRWVYVVCQTGINSPVVAFALRAKGYPHVGFIATGLVGWRLAHSELYARLAGRDVVQLTPRRLGAAE